MIELGRSISGLFRHPGYVSGRPYSTFPGYSAAAAVGAADTVYLYGFPVFHPVTIASLQMRIVTSGAGSSVKMGVWANSPVSNRPLGAPLIADNTGVATTSNNTTASADVTDTPLQPGWYWVGSKFTGTLPQPVCITSGSLWHAFQMGNAGAALVVMGLSSSDTYSNNLPTFAEGASFSSVIGTVPIVGFTVA